MSLCVRHHIQLNYFETVEDAKNLKEVPVVLIRVKTAPLKPRKNIQVINMKGNTEKYQNKLRRI